GGGSHQPCRGPSEKCRLSTKAGDEAVAHSGGVVQPSLIVRVRVCRVCVEREFYAFYAFGAIAESVSYRRVEGFESSSPFSGINTRFNFFLSVRINVSGVE